MSQPYLKVRFRIEQSMPNFPQFCFTVKSTLILTYSEKNSFTYKSVMVNACVAIHNYFHACVFVNSLRQGSGTHDSRARCGPCDDGIWVSDQSKMTYLTQ